MRGDAVLVSLNLKFREPFGNIWMDNLFFFFF